MVAEPEAEGSFRCWICLEDTETLDGMISPCACVGTNRWVHEDCLKTYCLQFLASNHSANSPSLQVACPICRKEYKITAQHDSSTASWRELFRWSSTDHQLLLRHARFFFLVMPLVCSSLVAWAWLVAYWEDLYFHGPGEPLMEGKEGRPPFEQPQEPPAMRSALMWLPRFISQFVDAHIVPFLPVETTGAGAGGDGGVERTGPAPAPSGGGPSAAVHPSGISKNWSMLYVWLQYGQWYKVLCWLLVLVLGGSEGLMPEGVREAFRVEELLLVSEARAQVFIFGQCVPFVLTKTRHFLVTWAGSSHVVRLIFYSAFTSHVEVASTLACDTLVAAHLLYDWVSSAASDYRLRLNLNRLRAGYFAIASLPRADGVGEAKPDRSGAAVDEAHARSRSGAAQRRAHEVDHE